MCLSINIGASVGLANVWQLLSATSEASARRWYLMFLVRVKSLLNIYLPELQLSVDYPPGKCDWFDWVSSLGLCGAFRPQNRKSVQVLLNWPLWRSLKPLDLGVMRKLLPSRYLPILDPVPSYSQAQGCTYCTWVLVSGQLPTILSHTELLNWISLSI